MKTVRQVPKRPREGPRSIVHPLCDPRSIVHPSCEKYFPTKFYHFCSIYAKEHEHNETKIYDQYCIKTVREVPGAHTLQEAFNIYKEPTKNINSQNKLVAGGKSPSFPPERLVKLAAERISRCQLQYRYFRK